MNARDVIKEAFITPFTNPDRRYVGVELEFPLISLSGEALKRDIIAPFTTHLLTNGFRVEETDIHGRGVFLINEDGDCLSFDNAYHNFEFAMAKADNLTMLAERFYHLYRLAQEFLLAHGHTLCGLGTNPRYSVSDPLPVEYPIYRTLRSFLAGFSGGDFHRYTNFPAWLSSVQTHMDVTAERLPRALTLMASLDFARALLFSNALPLAGAKGQENTLCFRDYLWEKSGFGSLADNVGPVCGRFDSCEDIVDMILKKSMFLRRDGEDYQVMPPVSVEDYFNAGAPPSDITAYLSFKNVEVTRRGTLEIRSDCAQPVGAAFAPPAFNLGILSVLEAAEALTEDFFAKALPADLAQAPDRNARLRRNVIYGEPLFAEEAAVKGFLYALVLLAEKGLKTRGFNEEKLLMPLYHRAESLVCPAKIFKERRQSGEAEGAILADYANPEKVF
ncbi:MAG: hypothetical protein E7414_02640 [Ruminococcaceae bacterium]|nr:hypothetical protein [Oscillospiraceae bacterium]